MHLYRTLLLVLGRGVFSFSSGNTGDNEKSMSVSRRSTRTGSDAGTEQDKTGYPDTDFVFREIT